MMMLWQPYPSGYFSSLQFSLCIPIALVYSVLARMIIRVVPPAIRQDPSDAATIASPDGRMLSPNQHDNTTMTRVAIVTGSNTGIGLETAKSLLSSNRYSHIVLACRSMDKARMAVRQLQRLQNEQQQQQPEKDDNSIHVISTTSVEAIQLDLRDMRSVVTFSNTIRERFEGNVSLLVNNAGCNTGGDVTEDGFESMFQTNFLGHFVLTLRVLDCMAPSARIINLSSVMHHFCGSGVNETESFWKAVATGKHDNNRYQYQLSKLAAILFTIELNRRYYPRITSVAVNPGAVNSDIWRNLPSFVRQRIFSLFYLNNAQGCQTTVAAASLALHRRLPIATNDDVTTHCIYLQPYWLPFSNNEQIPSPIFEMLGPFQGYWFTQPRLPENAVQICYAMWSAFESLTNHWQRR